MDSPSVTGPRDRYHLLSGLFARCPAGGGGATEPEARSKLAAAAGGFGLGWAGLCLTVLPVGSLVGFEMGIWARDGRWYPLIQAAFWVAV